MIAKRTKAIVVAGALTIVGAGMFTHASAEQVPPRCDYRERNPNAPEQLSQFEFLIGDFAIDAQGWTEDGWTPPNSIPPARWNGWYELGGMAIVDEWYNVEPGIEPEADRGINVRVFDTESQEWKMMWVFTASMQVQDLRAAMRDGVLTMWQVYPERPDFKAEFYIVDEDHWYRLSYTKDDDGNWVKQYKLNATRIPCTDN